MVSFLPDDTIELNRTTFHVQLLREHEAYLQELQRNDRMQLRVNFINKMDHICGLGGHIAG